MSDILIWLAPVAAITALFAACVVFFAMCRADNDDENVRRLLEWLLSDEGQELIEAVGYARIK